MRTGLFLTGLVGILVCLYTLKVEYEIEQHDENENEDDYEALCDINSYMSCTKVLKSKWSHCAFYFGLVDENSVFN